MPRSCCQGHASEGTPVCALNAELRYGLGLGFDGFGFDGAGASPVLQIKPPGS